MSLWIRNRAMGMIRKMARMKMRERIKRMAAVDRALLLNPEAMEELHLKEMVEKILYIPAAHAH
jgi:hypothetical protein